MEVITKIEVHLGMFLKELSRVFFKKDNLRSKSWWLSAFYSFCIQSIVRRGLMELTDDFKRNEHIASSCRSSPVREYLHLPLRLFVATSGIYDPLMKVYSLHDRLLFLKTDEEKALDDDFRAAQDAVKQDCWKSNGVSSSVQYLQNLFQDKGESLEI